jgi:mannose-6-phosphate isomerase-like protein (cupin superfamily)
MLRPIDLAEVLATFTETWSPRTVAQLNDYDIRVVKTLGEFSWHSHPETDEFFFVVRGQLTISMEAEEVTLGAGQLYVVPRGARHRPFSAEGADVLLIEPRETVNTGDTPSHLTAERQVLEPALD